MTTTLLCVLLTASMAGLVVTSEIRVENLITVERLPNTSGLYYQPTNRMQFIENIWNFVIEMDHSKVFQELNALHEESLKLLSEIETATNASSSCVQSNLVSMGIKNIIMKRIKDLVNNHNTLDSKIQKAGSFEDHKDLSLHTRKKRGLFNFVGNVDKYLFGVMDSNDAERLNELAKNNNALNEQVKSLTDELIKMASFEEHKKCIDEKRSEYCSYIVAKFDLIQEQLNQIEFLYENLEKSVDDAKQNHLNSLVLTPKRLLNEIINIHLPANLAWPVSSDMNGMNILIDNFVKSHVFITNMRKIIFIVEIPLINNVEYNLFQVIPIPMCRAKNGEHKCAIVLPNSKYIGLSKDRRNYVRLDDSPYCQTLHDRMFCSKPQIIYESNQAKLCDIKILLNNDVENIDFEKDCDVRVGKFDSEIFYPISDYNNWLYVLEKDTDLLFGCTVLEYHLKAGTGIIRGDGTKNCVMNTKKVILSLRKIKNTVALKTMITVPISSTFNLTAAINDIDKLNVLAINSNSDLDHTNLKGMTERLIDLRHRMNNNTMVEETDQATAESWMCWFASWFGLKCRTAETIIVCIILAFAFLLIFKIYNCCCAGTISKLFECCKSDKPSVIRVNNQLHYVEDNQPSFMMKLLNKNGKPVNKFDDDNEKEESNFYKNKM
ncbi:F-protein [Cryptophlebia peltastica nucleopolyhedrovirus]|uniref:F-protein n=1 Tax=Cryptophlebia peltastica nucleopolyhedrovirus TaxID=2304025 RepID=A0A346RNY7_9ABAC|nr:F-protein [Cryptophlebia peltastica nucleopolyhedrovirus]AXS67784.1 F-protein [Cryptophlebia peltastica nucleopolyhedrovirus]